MIYKNVIYYKLNSVNCAGNSVNYSYVKAERKNKLKI